MANIIRRNGGTSNVPAPVREWEPFRSLQELMGWDPFREMAPLGWEPAAFVASFEVKETKDAYLFKADVPGMKESDIEVSLTGNRLTVQGKREAEKREENETYFACERSYGSFVRAFTVPDGVDADGMRADLKDGVLTIMLPKRPEAKPKKIPIGAGQPKH
jgi:HSP20 family protein